MNISERINKRRNIQDTPDDSPSHTKPLNQLVDRWEQHQRTKHIPHSTHSYTHNPTMNQKKKNTEY